MVQGMRSYARSAAFAARPSVRRMEWYADRAADAVEPRALAVENYADNVAKEITPRIFDTENYANGAADSVSPSMLRMEGYAAEAAKAVVPDTRPALNSIGKWEEMLRKDEEDAVHAGIIAQKVASGEARRQAEEVGGGIAGVAREVGDEAARVSTGFGEGLSSAQRNVGQDAERVQNGIRAGMEGVRGEVGGLEGAVRTEAATSGEVQELVARVKSVFASAERRALSQIEQYRGAA